MLAYEDKIIIALDLDEKDAKALASELAGTAKWVKIGMTLFYQSGPAIIKYMKDLVYKVFLDLKLHDIPHQVEFAAGNLAKLGVDLLTIHTSGGLEMMKAARKGVIDTVGELTTGESGSSEHVAVDSSAMQPKAAILGVTVLTSLDEDAMNSIGWQSSPLDQVTRLAKLAMDAELEGIVCSPLEASKMRAALGPDALIVTPGIRLANKPNETQDNKRSVTQDNKRSVAQDNKKDDQARFMTPKDALLAGATHLVIGRPITKASDPVKAYKSIIEELEQ
jgi:orotidine-5'-phosphate decarboxylase